MARPNQGKKNKGKNTQQSRQSYKKPTKTNNVSSTLNVNVGKATSRVVVNRSESSDVSYPPYHFVPNPELPPSLSEAVLHHKTHDDTFSGELRCELTTVTDAIFAGYQKKFSDKEEFKQLKQSAGELGQRISPDQMTEKSVLYPLSYNNLTLIAGSSIKGMLRHSIAALASAPMLRVQEKTFSFRPNLGNSTKAQWRTYPAIIDAVDSDDNILRVRILHNINIQNDLSFKTDKIKEAIPDTVLHYKGGTDADWALATAFEECEHVQKNSVIVNAPAKIRQIKPTVVGRDVQKLYRLTTDHLCDQQGGHISSRHPKLPDRDHQRTLAQAIRENRTPQVNQLIFVEVEKRGNEFNVISLGNNYYYHWRYKDSLRTINVKNGTHFETENRRETSLLPEEKLTAYSRDNAEGDYKPSELNVVRALFGFTPDKDQNLSQQTGTEDSSAEEIAEKGLAGDRYAGRISINHAIEAPKSPASAVLKKNQWAALPSTGGPRASSVEFYVQQNKDNMMSTYGDSTHDQISLLNGRKFYPHHDGSRLPYEETPSTESIHSNLSPLASCVVPPQTQYRFSVRFRSLKDWELGMLLVSLSPDKLIQEFEASAVDKLKGSYQWIQSKLQQNEKHIMGNKLGYGRPFGYGSCVIDIASAKHIKNDALSSISTEQQKSCIQAFLTRFNCEAFDDVLLQWLKLHHLKTGKVFHYPPGNQKEEKETFAFHSDLRVHHIKHRRGVTNKNGEPVQKHRKAYLPEL
ncbi:hypothetical protein [Oceanospirillum beijerinckii]|uniref:hypothetical protein n=1 Tax=Oceanospirillum beijerinckii TaxID=64976 RepID=UPI00041D1852|nr:hypothetical protein [Oceanospirillum beijerinckii]